MKTQLKWEKVDVVFAAFLALWKTGLEEMVEALLGTEYAFWEKVFGVVLAVIAAVRVYYATKRENSDSNGNKE